MLVCLNKHSCKTSISHWSEVLNNKKSKFIFQSQNARQILGNNLKGGRGRSRDGYLPLIQTKVDSSIHEQSLAWTIWRILSKFALSNPRKILKHVEFYQIKSTCSWFNNSTLWLTSSQLTPRRVKNVQTQ